MRTTTPAQRTARLFWGVMGSSLLVVTGAVLVWLLDRCLEPKRLADHAANLGGPAVASPAHRETFC